MTHLKRKVDATRDGLVTTEQFIYQLTGKNSTTNKPYEVQCPNQSSVTVKVWLGGLLKQLGKK